MGKRLSWRQVRNNKRRRIVEASQRLLSSGRASERRLAGQVIGEVLRIVNAIRPGSSGAGIGRIIGKESGVGFARTCGDDAGGLPSSRNNVRRPG